MVIRILRCLTAQKLMILLMSGTCAATSTVASDIIEAQYNEQVRHTALAKIRAATRQFMDVETALAAGYISSIDLGAGCSTAAAEGHPEQLGAMGIHFVQLDDFGSPAFDFTEPSVLVYAPDPDVTHCSYTTDELLSDASCRESLSLVALEEVVIADLITSETGEHYWEQVPEFLGQQFYYLHDNPETTWVDEAHGFPPHYALHIWLYNHNPAGLFAPWNPRISCPASVSHGH